MTQTDTSTETIELLLKDVTPGPWEVNWTGNGHWIGESITVHDETPAGVSLTNFIAASRELVPALLAERDALKAKVERLKAQAVTVKPLEWADISYALSKATSFDMKFQVRLGTDGMVRWQSKHMGVWRDAPSFAAAKAAAQADYEARILSAITARTEAEVWNEAIEAARSTAEADGCDYTATLIAGLKRPVKGESHE